MNATIRETRENFYSALHSYIDSRANIKDITLNSKEIEAIENKYYELIKLIHDTLDNSRLEL